MIERFLFSYKGLYECLLVNSHRDSYSFIRPAKILFALPTGVYIDYFEKLWFKYLFRSELSVSSFKDPFRFCFEVNEEAIRMHLKLSIS